MKRIWKCSCWVLLGAFLCGSAGCVSNQQWSDFVRTEFARTISDVIGQLYLLYAESVT